jgi:tRNA nucleotidyltransferase (CCA-adding enzyme)
MRYMKVPGTTYLVGGSVRDTLLGREVQDHDWVVVGATPRAMPDARLTAVAADFPRLSAPANNRHTYALARAEHKCRQRLRGVV